MQRRASSLSGLLAALIVAMAAVTGAPAMAQAPPAQASQAQVSQAQASQGTAPVIYTMERLRTGPLASDIQQQMIPLHTLAAVESLLKANRIAFSWAVGEVSADKLPPATASKIAALPPNEVFVIPGADGVIMAVVIGRR